MNFEDLLKRAKKDRLLKPEEESDFDEFRHCEIYAHFRSRRTSSPACGAPSSMISHSTTCYSETRKRR